MVYNKTLQYHAGECKECKKAYLRQYRLDNNARLKQFDKDRYAKDPSYKRGKALEWAKDNREQHNANTQKWASANREKQHKAEKTWRLANPGKSNAKYHKRRALMGGGGTYRDCSWEALKAACDYRCLKCGQQEPAISLTVDHIIPIVKGGRNTIDNLQPLCKICNSSKGKKDTDYRNATHKSTGNFLQSVEDSGRQTGYEAGYSRAA